MPRSRWARNTSTSVTVGRAPPCVVEKDEDGMPWCPSQVPADSSVSGDGLTI